MAGSPSICASSFDLYWAFYDYTEALSRSGWAWEFLRRHPDFQRAAKGETNRPNIAQERLGTTVFSLARPVKTAEAWGLRFFPDPGMPGGVTPIFWSQNLYRGSLLARTTSQASNDNAPFHLADIPGRRALLLTPDGQAQLAIEAHSFSALIKFDHAPSAPPDTLTLAIEHGGIEELDARLRALRAFIDYCQQRFHPSPPERGFAPQRLKESLLALDGKLAGASLRQIAELLFGADCVRKDWNEGSRYTRERTRRAVCRGLQLMDGGWRSLLI